MGKTSNEVKRRYNSKTYKQTMVNIDINDAAIIKQWCREHGLAMSGYIYSCIIKDMKEKGIELQGTVTMRTGDDDENMQ